MIPIARPLISEDEVHAVMEVLRSGQLAQGPAVAKLESAFAERCGVSHAIATTSGTTALHVALLAHGIGPGDEVITTAFSFIASANAILYVNARPVFADIDPDTLTLDPADVERKITSRTKAIVPVHLYGNPADMNRLTAIAERHGIPIIEDACQAHGATYDGQTVGSIGTGCFSFYPTKNMTAGEGGMITTNDAKIAERARLIRSHGMPQRYVHEILGYNFRLSDIHAAIALVQLEKLDSWTGRRVHNARLLQEKLRDAGVAFQAVLPEATHVYHQFTVGIRSGRDAVADYLKDHGVGCEIYYPIPIHQQPLYKDLGYDDHLPVTERASLEVLSLPVHPSVTYEDTDQVASTLKRALAAVREPALVAD